MKHKLLISLSATVPFAALALSSAMAQPPTATASKLVSYASFANGGARPNWHVRIVSPVTFVVSDKVAPSGILAATPSQAATLLDS